MNGVNDYVERMVKRSVPNQVVLAKVENVDAEGYACEVSIEGRPNRLKVRIRSVIDGSQEGVLILPKVGSFVLVGLINNNPNSNYIVSFSEVDDIWLQSPTIKLNGDANGGLVQIEYLLERLNSLEDILADLILKYDAHTHPVPKPAGPTGLPAVLSAQAPGKTVRADLENDKVTHG
jgi:hypothetical protein